MKFTLEFTSLTKTIQHLAYDLVAYGEIAPYMASYLFDQYYQDDDNTRKNHKYIFCASSINSETIGFMQETEYPQNIFLYFDRMNKSLYNDATKRNIRCLVQAKDLIGIKNIKPSTIKMDNYYSEYLLNSFDKKKKIDHIDIVAHLSGVEKLPVELINVLYPNTNLNIKLFDGLYIDHPQNIGYIDDPFFMELVNNCQMLLALNNTFVPYALILGKPVLCVEGNNWMKKSTISKETLTNIDQLPKPSLSIQDIKQSSYKNFIEKHLL
jgi:hypothetical protein